MNSTTPLNLIMLKSQRSEIIAAGCAILFGYFVSQSDYSAQLRCCEPTGTHW